MSSNMRRQMCGRSAEVLPAGPLVLRERHGAVLDADLDAMVLGEFDERPPGFQKPWPVVVHGFGPVAAHEGVDHAQAQQFGRLDHEPQVLDVNARFGGVGRQRIGIIAQAADGHARLFHGVADALWHHQP